VAAGNPADFTVYLANREASGPGICAVRPNRREAIINLDLWWPQGIRFGALTVGLCCFR
jgi:hypothetical protein